MGAIARGLRNVYRNKARAILVMVILGLSVGVYLTMSRVSAGIEENITTVAAEVQTLLELRAAGATGMGVGVDALPEDFFDPAREMPNVVKVEKYLYQRMFDPNRAASISIIVGVGPGATLRLATHGELGKPKIIDGRDLSPQDKGKSVAVVGKAYADYYNLKVGDTFILRADQVALQDRPDPNVVIKDTEAKVIGIFESGFVFGDNQLFMPLDVTQRIFKQEGKASHAFVTASSVNKVEEVQEALWEKFQGKADVISGLNIAASWAKALKAIRLNSLLAAGVSAGAGALVVLFTMMLITRERTREIGILKAIGASNGDITTQFIAESSGIAFIGGLVGLMVFTVAAPRVANVLLGVATSALNPLTAMGGEDPASSLLLRYTVSLGSLINTLGLVLVLSIVASLASVIKALRLRPVEAMRQE